MTLKGTVSKHMRLLEPTTKIRMKIDAYYQRLDSVDIRFMRIFAGVLWRGASNNTGVIENVDFRAFGRYFFGTLGNEAKIIA